MSIRTVLSKYFDKILCEDQGRYIMCIARYAGEDYVLCISLTGKAPYAKIMKADKVPAMECRMLEYDPRGLYAFGENIEVLAKKILKKTEANIL